ncbi:hypothetical protein Tco_1072293, partial [Tanacetum coccineum]
HLDNFDKVVKVRTKFTRQNEGTWGFEHIKKAFEKDVIPFMQSLRESFKEFDKGLQVEIKEMKDVFNQMESEVEQCSVDKKCFEIQKKELFLKMINSHRIQPVLYDGTVLAKKHDVIFVTDLKETLTPAKDSQ